MDIIPRIRGLTENPDIPAKSRDTLDPSCLKTTSAISRPVNISWTIRAKWNGRWMRARPSKTLRRIGKSS